VKAIILGGTFDPVHIGHLHLADLAAHRFGAGEVIFIPSYVSPHKEGRRTEPAEHRIAMLEIALKGTPWRVDTCEIRRGGTSYTIDSVRELKESCGWSEPPGLLLGDDLSAGFSRWKEPEALSREARLILASRLETSAGTFPYPHERLNNRILNVSSTEVRRALREGDAVRYLLPPGVWEYIRREGLYGFRDQD